MIEFGAMLWTHTLCNDYSHGTVPTITITEVRWGMHVDRPARTVWLLHTALDIHSDLSGKACVCRAGLGCTKLNSLLNLLVGSSQQQLSSMLKKVYFWNPDLYSGALHMFSELMFPPSPSLWRPELQFFQSCLRLRLQPPFQKFQFLTGYDSCNVTIYYYWHCS